MFIHTSIWNKLQETIKEKGFFKNKKNTKKCNENTDFLNIVNNQEDIDFFTENTFQEATKKLSETLYKYIIHLIDFKYKTSDEIDEKDKVKQKFYEIILKTKDSNKFIENKFVLPKYDLSDELIVSLKESNIDIEYWNFRLLLEEYLK